MSLHRLQCSRMCCSVSEMTSYPSMHPSIHLSFTLCCSSVVTLLSCLSFVTFFLPCILSHSLLSTPFLCFLPIILFFPFLTSFPSLLFLLLFLSLSLSLIFPCFYLPAVSFLSLSFTLSLFCSLILSPFSHFYQSSFSLMSSLYFMLSLSLLPFSAWLARFVYLLSLVLVESYIYIFSFLSPCRAHLRCVFSSSLFLFLSWTD